MEMDNLEEFMKKVGKLKHLKRQGWVNHMICNPETIAGHMYRMAILALLVDPKDNLDKSKIIEMALLHDLAECEVGDITPDDGILPEVKHKLEDDAMKSICALLGEKGNSLLEMFQEYEKQESPEAQYVKDLDRLDLIMQAYEYEERDKTPGKLEEFFKNTNAHFKHASIRKIADAINAKRDKTLKKK